MYMAAVMYRDGMGTDSDPKRAEEWFDAFAHSGLTRFMVWEGDVLKFFPDLDPGWSAADCYEVAAKYRNAGGSGALGVLYRDGANVLADPEASEKWFKEQAESWGWPMAGAADFHYKGYGGKPDFKRAAEFYSEMAAMGDATACYRLALMRRDGKGIEKDMAEYRRLLWCAGERGNRDALVLLGSRGKH